MTSAYPVAVVEGSQRYYWAADQETGAYCLFFYLVCQ